AAEHEKGRRLLVVTTNLDTQDTVIWDMGVLAGQGGEQAAALFRRVLLASASIPGVFPPVLIPGVDGAGGLVEEMHVDGGVNTPFLAVPESLLTVTTPTRAPEGTALYVLVNGHVGRNERITQGNLRAILARSYDTMSKASLRTSLQVNLAFAERNGIRMYVAAIPDEVEASSLDFAPEPMADLFERGRAAGAAGAAWSEMRSTAIEPDAESVAGLARHPARPANPDGPAVHSQRSCQPVPPSQGHRSPIHAAETLARAPLAIQHLGPEGRRRAVEGDRQHAVLDAAAALHARGGFLADETALAEVDAVQQVEIS